MCNLKQYPIIIYDPLINQSFYQLKGIIMEAEFLHKFYDQLFETELKCFSDNDPLFGYSTVVLNVCRRIKEVFNNSKTATSTFCEYILNNLLFFDLQIPNNCFHNFLRSLRLEENYIIYFTQISLRMFLLSFLCKSGQEHKKSDWKIGLQQFIKQARVQFMFNCHQSLATTLVNLLDKIEPICNQLPFYENMLLAFARQDLDFTIQHIDKKITKIKQNWKQNINRNKVQFTPSNTKKNEKDSKDGEKSKYCKKYVKIAPQLQKDQFSEVLIKRISNFKQQQKKRYSQHIQSSKKRTLFHQRKYFKKIESTDSGTKQQQSFFIQQQQQKTQTQTQTYIRKQTILKKVEVRQMNTQNKSSQIEMEGKNNQIMKSNNLETDTQDFIVTGTPPKSKCKSIFKLSKQN